MVTQVQSEFGGIDILVNNASIRDSEGLFGLSIEEFDKVVAVNLRGTFLCTREVAKVMRESDGNGRIINISSTSGKSGRANSIAYSTTKAGLLNFTRSIAKALAEHGVRVNTIIPTRTGLGTLGTEYEHREDDPDIDHQIAQDILAKRLGEPKDIAMTALFLITPASEFINGTEILVDGGRSA
jgi:NAD(P)-dependent dehydrogenase (short-subunit alcohol dehydrogenase family)